MLARQRRPRAVGRLGRFVVLTAGCSLALGLQAWGQRGGDSQHPPGDHHKEDESRTYDGTGNNIANPTWGSAGVELLRVAGADYADGVSAPAGASRPGPRTISNLVAAQAGSFPNDRGLTDMVWQWGQFVDHDLDLTDPAEPPEPLPIPVPAGDPFFDPLDTGAAEIEFFRSQFSVASGADVNNPRQQTNAITAYLDGSNVYGSSAVTAAELRTFAGGRMLVSEGNLLPMVEGAFIAGDVRANEQVGLTSLHTLFVREHNRLADEIAARKCKLTDEEIFQQARQQVIAILQAITYNEFLPALLGENAVAEYRGYDPGLEVGIANSFSTAAYRLGHSMLNSQLLRLDDDGRVIPEGHLPLRDAFFNPAEVINVGIEPYLMGLSMQQAQEVDTMIVDDVRNFLFGDPGEGGFDLASLNIQRGRDHGLPDYNSLRVAFGLPAVGSFAEITPDLELQLLLASAYGTVDDIDAWVGCLAEDHLPNSSVGPLVHVVLVTQFLVVRDGDRFWYQRIFKDRELKRIEQTRLSDVIRRNTTLTNIPDNVFRAEQAHGKPYPLRESRAAGRMR